MGPTRAEFATPRRALARLFVPSFALLALACRSLPEIPVGICGNGVIEGNEDCDSFSKDGYTCRAPGSAAECRLDCSPRVDGSRVECPVGYGCDEQGACRQGSGEYRALPEVIPGNASTLLSGDFDGDGRDDVLSLEPTGFFGFTKTRLHFFDRVAAWAESWSSSRSLADPRVANVSDDARSDLVFSDFRVNVWLGAPNRSLIAGIYATYRLPYEGTRLVPVLDGGEVSDTSPLAVLTEQEGKLGLYVPDQGEETLRAAALFPEQRDQLVAEPVTGDVFEDDSDYPCLEVVVPHPIVGEVRVYSLCARGESAQPIWREQAEVARVELEPPAELDGRVSIADVDGDGHQDLLVSAESVLYVAYGDGQRLLPARPLLAVLDQAPRKPLPAPLTAGDFNGDGAADFVFPQLLVVSQRAADGIITYVGAHGRLRTPWTAARIADLNGNGLPDVVAASNRAADIDFFNGTSRGALNPFTIPTTQPVEHLTLGDFDGDLLQDLAFAQRASGDAEDEVSIAYGTYAGPPSHPLAAARARNVVQTTSFLDLVNDGAAELVVNYRGQTASGAPGVAVALLQGDGSRSLPCPIDLTTFASDRSLVSAPSLLVAVGSFLRPGQLDALPVALECAQGAEECSIQAQQPKLWFLADLRGQQSFPVRLGWDFDPRILPFEFVGEVPELALQLGAADLDADGLDEVVLAGNDSPGSRCILTSASLEGDGVPRLSVGSTLVVDEPCAPLGPLSVTDVDGDGAIDIAFLSGKSGSTRKIQVLWNDGRGNFERERAATLTTDAESVAAFSVFRPRPDLRPHVAYVTADSARLLRPIANARSFEVADLPIELDAGTGITAADVDGDGLVDLTVADAGNLRVLRAERMP